MNGLELSRKSLEIAPHMPIILSTGNISPEFLRMAAEAGIAAVLAKPFFPNELFKVIKEVMRKPVNSARNEEICRKDGVK